MITADSLSTVTTANVWLLVIRISGEAPNLIFNNPDASTTPTLCPQTHRPTPTFCSTRLTWTETARSASRTLSSACRCCSGARWPRSSTGLLICTTSIKTATSPKRCVIWQNVTFQEQQHENRGNDWNELNRQMHESSGGSVDQTLLCTELAASWQVQL